jgi:hypothetical protein
MNTKLVVVLCSALVAAIASLQWEIINLNSDLEKLRVGDLTVVAAIQKFEKDLIAKQRADEKARLAAQAIQDAQRNAALQQGLNWLPTGDMNKPVLWGDQPKKKVNQ